MNNRTRRYISLIGGVLALSLTLASNTLPALAAGKNVQVDDDRRQCPRATFTDIQSAINSLGANPTGTITVCAGQYATTGLTVTRGHNLKLVGNKGAVITPSFAASPTFDGILLDIQGASNVTVQGLTFDGQGALSAPDTNVAAIRFLATSGTIQKNTITNWHEPTFSIDDPRAIQVLSLFSETETVKLTSNMITQYQGEAIHVEGPTHMKITGNRLSGAADILNSPIGIVITPGIRGIGASGQVSGNTITGNLSPDANAFGVGIQVIETSGLTISSNTLTHLDEGIVVENICQTLQSTDNNIIKGNKISEVIEGVQVVARGVNSGLNHCNPHVDNLHITGNKILNTTMGGSAAIILLVSGPNGSQAFALNEHVTGNTFGGFGQGVALFDQPGGTIQGVFTPNTIKS